MTTRERLKKYISENGVRQDFIAQKIGVSKAMITLYLQNKRNLSQDNEKRLQNFLDSKCLN